MVSSPAVVGHPVSAQADALLTPQALSFLADLHRHFDHERGVLLQMRRTRQQQRDNGILPNFLKETAHIRQDPTWAVAAIPKDLTDRRVEITGPVDRKTVINALNSGANGFMADFEDATAPTWTTLMQGQVNLYDAVRRTLRLETPDKTYTLVDKPAVLIVRPRGWHLNEAHILVDDAPMSASLFDFGLFVFHNAAALLARGTAPYFYLPKLENHLEARLWRSVLERAEHLLGLPAGTFKVTVLIETLGAAFEAEEILYELKDHIVALNCGRWDYMFSYIKTLRTHPQYVLPDRAQVSMQAPMMNAYVRLVIAACHKRGAYAMGGMAAQIPIKDNPDANEAALSRVRADKEREARLGHDGTWVAHPALVSLARQAFPRVNQLNVIPDTSDITQTTLLTPPEGSLTEEGQRMNMRVALTYMASWLSGVGCVPIHHLMEDAATAEICRAQLWQALHHGVRLADGRAFTRDLFDLWFAQEAGALDLPNQAPAQTMLHDLCTRQDFVAFLTLPAYEHLIKNP
ncbi:MAG: malate synthase A [Alphaproteobacteria bacterium]